MGGPNPQRGFRGLAASGLGFMGVKGVSCFLFFSGVGFRLQGCRFQDLGVRGLGSR